MENENNYQNTQCTSNKGNSQEFSGSDKEGERIREILEYNLSNFDKDDHGLHTLTQLAAKICNTEMSFVTLVGQKYIEFLSRFNSDWKGTDRQNSFCNLAIEQDEFFEIEDSTKDDRFVESCYTKGPTPLKYYGGYPLKNSKGYNLGCLVVCDWQTKRLNEFQVLTLKTLAEQVVVHLEMRKLNAKLSVALERAQAKDDFVSNMSHELRTPLNAINGFADILSKTKLDSEKKQAVDIIQSSSGVLLTLINDILDLSKLQSKRLELDRRAFNLKLAMNNIFNLLSKKAEENKVILSFRIDDKIPDFVNGDRIRLNQIIMNLLGNALKFTENGTVEIKVKLRGETTSQVNLEFSVKDTGIGIPEDKLKLIFERFEQGSKDTFRSYGGTGLGLNISKELVELQGGKLKVESKVNQGSKFSFSLTYDKSNEKEIFKNNKAPNVDKLSKLNILFCEDDAFNILLIKNLFKNRESSVQIAENGRLAIDILSKTQNFDIIFMDINMPVMDGIETTEYIRNVLNLSIPIIGFTANNSKKERDYCLDNGMNDYITKNLATNEFYKILSKVSKNVNIFSDNNSNDDNVNCTKSRHRSFEINKNFIDSNEFVLEERETILEDKIIFNLKTNENLKKKFTENNILIKNEGHFKNIEHDKENYPLYDLNLTVPKFDNSSLKEISDGDSELEQTILDVFIKENIEQMEIIQEAVNSRNEEIIRFNLHKMKSALLTLGFHPLVEHNDRIRNMIVVDKVRNETLVREFKIFKIKMMNVRISVENYLKEVVNYNN